MPLPTTDFIVNGQEYSATNYSASAQYNYTLTQYWLAVENHLKNMTYINDFNDTISWYQETYYEGYDEVDSGTLQVIANAINWYDYLHQTLNMTLLIMQTMGDDSAGLRSATDIWGYSTGGGEPVDFQLWRV